MGSPLRGQGSFLLDRNEGFSLPIWVRYTGQFLVGPHTSVCGVSARPVPQDVLPSGPRCVHELRLSLALPSVLPCPMLGFSVASLTLARVLGCLWYTTLISAGWGLCLGRWLSFAPCSLAGALFPGGPL